MARVLINASNLHVGGGVQVATSFIANLIESVVGSSPLEFVIYSSTEVDLNLRGLGIEVDNCENYFVLDVAGVEALRSKVARRFYGFDLVFTIFGPLYLPKAIPNHVVGFAQPWIIYPANEAYSRLSIKDRLLFRLKFEIQWLFFSRAQRLIVELDHAKHGLVNARKFAANKIDVVRNCVSPIFFDELKWERISGFAEEPEVDTRIGYVTRGYPHKNIDFLLEVSRELKQISNQNYQFFVTLNEDEWRQRSFRFQCEIRNVGPLRVAQCPTFYQAMNGVIFPSLLECFSATPLEAMAMRRPLFASDRGFVRDSCGNSANYFNPLDARSAATCIQAWYEDTPKEDQTERVERSFRKLLELPNSNDRTVSYLAIIEKQLGNDSCE